MLGVCYWECIFYSSDTFMAEEIAQYEIGKRHVANIMGLDPENITQEDIDVSQAFYCNSLCLC